MKERMDLEQDVVLSSRVRLARNYEDIPFTPVMSRDNAKETIRRASHAVLDAADGGAYTLKRMADLSESERARLVEHRLISYDLLKFAENSAAMISDDESVSVMINEEDHLRIQGLMPGLQLEHAARMAFRADDELGKEAVYAFDPQWGYLTSCPTNTGTGMRASTMLHLPALSAAGQIGTIVQMVSKLGFTVRGLYGEGSDAQGNLYQLSNQVTLGKTEEDMIKSLMAATRQIAGHERALREKVKEEDIVAVMDKLMRSVGILAHARMMPLTEFMQRYSDLRLAAAIGLITASIEPIDAMMMDLQPGSLSVSAGRALTESEQNIMRADRIREQIARIAHRS